MNRYWKLLLVVSKGLSATVEKYTSISPKDDKLAALTTNTGSPTKIADTVVEPLEVALIVVVLLTVDMYFKVIIVKLFDYMLLIMP